MRYAGRKGVTGKGRGEGVMGEKKGGDSMFRKKY